MAARNKPAGIRSLVYGMSKGKVGIEGSSVSGRPMATELYLLYLYSLHDPPNLADYGWGWLHRSPRGR
jgi:hypothetical protein